MFVKLILPALAEAKTISKRSIKYSLFPPLGLATLAGYLSGDDEIVLEDEHVERLILDDEPDLVGIETYITSANRAYEIADQYRARGVKVVLGGLHPTSLPDEALQHADAIVTGPAEEAWPRLLDDFRKGELKRTYRSTARTLEGLPAIRRDLIRRKNYLVPNSIVVSRGCPHSCDFCYKTSFYEGGRSFYTYRVDQALAEIDSLPGRHLYFLDDNLFASPRFARELFEGMRGMRRVWQGAATLAALRDESLLDAAVDSGLRSLFIGFESLNQDAMQGGNKTHNHVEEYAGVARRLHERGVMINASFVFGFDQDDESTFDATVDWAVAQGLETATFHILTPYPGTPLFQRYQAEGRLLHEDWDQYDTRHAVFRHPTMSAETIEAGYRRAYRRFYQWRNIARGACAKPNLTGRAKHFAYSAAWKKFNPLWATLIRMRKISLGIRPLETVLNLRPNASSQPTVIETAESGEFHSPAKLR